MATVCGDGRRRYGALVLVDEMRAAVGSDHVFDGAGTSHVVDWTGRFVGATDLVVRPGSLEEVRRVLTIARAHGRAVVPQGGNTGLVGGSVPLHGEIVLSSARLNEVGVADVDARRIVVGAGATLEAVQVAAASVGLRYPVDFGARASATIGGTIATNAGGVNVLRYGTTRAQVLGLEAVLADGSIVSTMAGLMKDNTGYDLRGLLCGSEGTLGVITRAVLRLVPAHVSVTTVLVGCESVEDAMSVVGRVGRASDSVDAAELMSRRGVSLTSEVTGVGAPFDAAWYVLVESSVGEEQGDPLARLLSGRSQVAVAESPARRRALWRLRDEHTPSIATLGTPLKYDVTLPLASLPRFVDEVGEAVTSVAPTAETIVFGHAADGNLHVNVLGAREERAIDETVLTTVAAHRGSISAEHGVGIAKREWLHLTRSAEEIAAMRAIKRALDPDGILNPNVLLPPEPTA
jgi:FAD/FMN-containing dehydrogenase